MLQKLNERIQGLVAWIVISLVAITFTLFGVDYYLQSHHESSAQADVNGEPITKQSFDLTYRRARQSRSLPQLSAARDNQFKQQLLKEMIVNTVTVQAAHSNGFEVSPSQADAAILSIPQFQEEGHFSSDRYTQALNGALFTPQSFQKEVRQGMLLNQQRFAFIGTAFVLPKDIEQFVKLYMQTRDYDYVTIPASRFSDLIKVSDEAIASYYQQHPKAFLSPEEVSIDYVRLSLPDIKKTIDISEPQIRQYYDENKSTMTKPYLDVKSDIHEQLLAERAQAIYAQTLEQLSDVSYQSPDTLKPTAKLLSLPIESTGLFSRLGGDEPLLKNRLVVDAAFSHDVLELGNNSDPIQLDNDSVVVLRVNKHDLASERSLNDVKDMIYKKLVKKNAEKEAMNIGAALISQKDALPAQIKLMEENHLTWKPVKLAGRDGDEKMQSINEIAFNLPRVGDVAGDRLPNGDYVVVSLKAINNGRLDRLDHEQLASITQQIESNNGVMDYELYVNGLMVKASIVTH